MQNPKNIFKSRLTQAGCQIGVWNAIGGNTVPEALASIGYDWICIDTEHAAVETVEVLPALQSIAAYPNTSAIVRPAANDPVLFKRILDMGAQSLLVPYIETAKEARVAIDAMRYGPTGIRGTAGMTRATRYGRIGDYFKLAEKELCLVVQIETVKGISNLEEIAKTDGVDAIFFGPADLSASMGLPGEMDHPEVLATIESAVEKLKEMDVPFGTMALSHTGAERFIELGAAFVAVAVDSVSMVGALMQIRNHFKSD